MKTIEMKPLTREAFAPFGQVIEQDGAPNFPINAGKCTRFHDLARIETTGEKARPMISLLRGEPYPLPLELNMVERLHGEIRKILAEPEMQDKLKGFGMQPADMSTAQVAAFQKAEVEKWAQVIKAANIKAE